jgi:hypothetical protein
MAIVKVRQGYHCYTNSLWSAHLSQPSLGSESMKVLIPGLTARPVGVGSGTFCPDWSYQLGPKVPHLYQLEMRDFWLQLGLKGYSFIRIGVILVGVINPD